MYNVLSSSESHFMAAYINLSAIEGCAGKVFIVYHTESINKPVSMIFYQQSTFHVNLLMK